MSLDKHLRQFQEPPHPLRDPPGPPFLPPEPSFTYSKMSSTWGTHVLCVSVVLLWLGRARSDGRSPVWRSPPGSFWLFVATNTLH